MSEKQIKITALTVEELVRLLNSSGRQIPSEDVRKIVHEAGIIRPDGTVSLIDYAAALVKELGRGGD